MASLKDITECQPMETSAVHKKIYQDLIDSLPQIVFNADTAGRLTFANRTAFAMSGYTPKDLEKGLSILQTVIPEDRERVASNMEKLLSGADIGAQEYTFVRKDGSTFPVIAQSHPTMRDGKAVGLRGFVIDITDHKRTEDALRESEKKYHQLFDLESDAIFLINSETGEIIEVNTSASVLYGYSREELLHLKHTDLSAEPEKTRQAALDREKRIPLRLHRRRDGTVFPVEITATHFSWHGSSVHIAAIRDITERIHAEEALRKSHELFETLARISPVGIFRTDSEGRYIYVNECWSRITSLTPEQAEGEGWTQALHPEDRGAVEQQWYDAVKNDLPFKFEYRFLRPDGSIAWVIGQAVMVKGASGDVRGYVGSTTDITDRKHVEEALLASEQRYQKLSITDGLTGLFNLRHFYDQLNSEISRAIRYKHPLTLLLLDIDNFKKYNDSFGHLEGDKVLEQLAEVVRRYLRQTDSAYRYGGEEFIVILPHTSGRAGKITAERIRSEFKKALLPPGGGKGFQVTVSIGIAEYVISEGIDEFIMRADRNMYKAKENGKDQVFFSK